MNCAADSNHSTDATGELLGAKDTPPATPRGTTSAGSPLNGAAVSNAGSSISTIASTVSSVVSSTTSSVLALPSAPSPVPPVGPPKGKLIVKIQEARGLIPSKYPYVVCTFESNEFISKGPRRSFDGVEGADKGARNVYSGQTSPVDKGRSIAIPMTSRQSSSTSLSEMQGKAGGSTNPKWEHNAVL